MPLTKLDLNTLAGGEAIDQLNRAIDAVSEDVIKRPGIAAKRKVTFTVAISPLVDPNSNRNFPTASYSVSTTIPGVKSPNFPCSVRGGQVFINEEQPSLFIEGEK